MRFSIEARTPFADDISLIEYVFQIPSVYKIHLGWSKYLVRALAETIAPDEIVTRRDKVGFATPTYMWVQNNRDMLESYLTKDLSHLLDGDRIRRDWLILAQRGSQNGIQKLWRIINVGVWKHVYAL
jgi:asparagine synthase (glutamine-hydrolysing)